MLPQFFGTGGLLSLLVTTYQWLLPALDSIAMFRSGYACGGNSRCSAGAATTDSTLFYKPTLAAIINKQIASSPAARIEEPPPHPNASQLSH